MVTERTRDEFERPAADLFLLFTMLSLILAHPLLDGVIWGRIVLGILTFVPLIVAMVRMADRKELVWPFAALLLTAFACSVAAYVSGSQTLHAIQWALTALAFAVSVGGLFSYLQAATRVTAGHLYTAGSIYLLLVGLFFALYQSFAAVLPGAFEKTSGATTGQAVDLLYFSMVTLTTVGYGDIVPVNGIVRIIAGLEATTGVLYVAITVSILVSGYKGRASS